MLPVLLVKSGVLENYATVALPAGQAEKIAAIIDGALSESSKVSGEIRTWLRAHLANRE